MQPTSPAPLECPPLAEAIDRILATGTTNPQALLAPGFRSSMEAALQSPVEPIRNGAPTTLFKDGEKPIHRLICYMSLGGKTNTAIAEEVGMSAAAIGNILRQPASQDFMAREAKRMAGDEIENRFKGQLDATIQTLIEIRDDTKAPVNSRVAVCNTILDRALGKPTVYVKNESRISYDDAKSELAEIDRQLAALKTQTRTEVPSGN